MFVKDAEVIPVFRGRDPTHLVGFTPASKTSDEIYLAWQETTS